MIAAGQIAQHVFAQLGRGGPGVAERYVAIPGNESMRWLLPANGEAIDSVLARWTPYRMTSRIAWATVRAASGIGAIAGLPGVAVVEVERPRRVDWQVLGWRWEGTPIPVIYVGTPGPRRKAVLHLMERATARCRAVVKVPLTADAKLALLHEAVVLAELEEERQESAPRLLEVDRARGVVTQTFVEGRPGSRKLDAEHWRLLRSLILTGESTSLRAHAERWELEAIGQRVPENVEIALDALADTELLPACWQHGDFTPWNIRRMADGRLVLLDWEEARRGGLPLCDAFHFLHVQDFLFGRKPQLHGGDIGETARALGISARMVAKLEMAYLVGEYVTCAGRGIEERARFIESTLTKLQRRAA
jgi:hypothetical protein